MAKKKFHGMYEGSSERRHQEMKDAGMIHEDKSAVANMPQGVMYKSWPKSNVGLDSRLDDTISGIDRQMNMDDSAAKRHNVPKKW